MTLYTKYRPRTFSQVVGQNSIVSTLTHDVKAQSTSHAYLFSGPRGTGKTTTARILALALNCQSPVETPVGVDPCLECASCSDILYDTSLDLVEFDAASNSGVDAVRAIIEKVSYSSPGNKKVYIIDEAHMLSEAAFNALLKTLEEPPGHVVFVLATTNPRKIPATVLSRLEKHEFALVPSETMTTLLLEIAERESIDPSLVPVAVNMGQGSVRDALSALDSIKNMNPEAVQLGTSPAVALVSAMPSRRLSVLYKVVAEQSSEGADLRGLTEEAIGILRDCFLIQMGAGELITTMDWGGRDALATELGARATVSAIEFLGESVSSMANGYDPRVNLEIALGRWAKTNPAQR